MNRELKEKFILKIPCMQKVKKDSKNKRIVGMTKFTPLKSLLQPKDTRERKSILNGGIQEVVT